MSPADRDLQSLVCALGAESSAAESDAIAQIVALFNRYAPAVRALLLRRLGNLDDAREASQEVFLHLWRQARQGRLESEARAYLFVAAENVARDWRRRARSRASDRHEPLEGHEELPTHEPDGVDAAHWREGLARVLDAVRELPPETQRIFGLYHGSRMTYPDIARQLGVTTRTVERHMAQALAHCKNRIRAWL